VDTGLPRILYIGQHFAASHQPTTGIVQGWGMPAAPPWHPYKGNSNDLVLHAIPGISVHGTISGAPEAVFTDANGNFVLNSGSSGQTITVDATFGRQGQGYRIDNTFLSINDYLAASSNASVGSDIALTLTSNNSHFTEEMRVAQVDAALAAVRARSFATQYIGSLSFAVALMPNVPQVGLTCGAASGGPMLYTISLAPYIENNLWNCATHSIIAHEFGHCLLDNLGITTVMQRGFHEGFSDVFNAMLKDINVMGPSQRTNGDNIRDDPRLQHINCQFPLTQYSTSHQYCGCFHPDAPYLPSQLTAGVWVRIRIGFKEVYGNVNGLDNACTLFGNWCLLTVGGDDCQGLHPGSLAEVLTSMPSEDQTWIQIIETAFFEHNICTHGPCTN
jgi:hypothetical protein